MASDYYLKLDGVKGESETIKESMEISTFDWGATQPGSAASGSGLTTGKVKMDDFSFTMPNNTASPTLMLLCATGKHIAKGQLQCRKASGKEGKQATATYLTVDFENLIISSYKTNGPGGDESNPTDTISFNYTKLTIEYFVQDKEGNVKVSAGKTSFDVKTGAGNR